MPDLDWQARAACLGDLYFTERESWETRPVCAGCPVRLECLVAATDWKPTAQCGNGLHFSPTPRQARNLAASPATRFLAVWVAVADLIPIGDDKCKAPACDVAYEVDIWGDRIEATA